MFAIKDAPVPAPPPNPINAVIVFVVTAVITVAIPAIGSGKPVVFESARGYAWFDWKSSLEHVNTRLPVSIPTKLPTLNPWFAIVNVSNPVWEI